MSGYPAPGQPDLGQSDLGLAWRVPEPPPAPLELAREATAAALTALLLVPMGAPLGLLWAAFRPHLDVAAAATQESAFEAQYVADVRLLLLGLAAGVLAGIAAWVLARRHGLGVLAGLAVGGALAMVLAAKVGALAAHPATLEAQVTSAFAARGYNDFRSLDPDTRALFLGQVRFGLRATPVVLALPLAAAASFGVLTWLRDRCSRPAAPGRAPRD